MRNLTRHCSTKSQIGENFGQGDQSRSLRALTEIDIWTKKTKLGPENVINESRIALFLLSKASDQVSSQQIHSCLMKMTKASLFEESDIGTMQLLLEIVPLEGLTQKMQEKLYRYTMLLMESRECSLLIKIGHCLSLMDLFHKDPAELKEQSLATFCAEYLLRRPQFLNLAELLRLYYVGNSIQILSRDQNELIEELASQHLVEVDLKLMSEHAKLDFLWALALQRYQLLGETEGVYDRIEMTDYTDLQTTLIHDLFCNLNSSKKLIRSRPWQR